MKTLGLVLLLSLSFPVLSNPLHEKSLGKLDRMEFSSKGENHIDITPGDTIASIPDIRAVLGSPARNIAVRGDTVVVISSPPSGDPDNIFEGVVAYYSFDGGQTFLSHQLSPSSLAFTYSGVEWPENWETPIFFWQETQYSRGYEPSRIKMAWDTSFPSGIFKEIELPQSQQWDSWIPSLDASGDTIIVTAANLDDDYYSFIWKSYDRGLSWFSDTFLTQGESNNWHDTPIIRIGSNGYVACITDWITTDLGWQAITPFFLESIDGGQTWSSPLNLWEASGWTPYDSAGGWWYVYNFILDNEDRPHIAWRFGIGEHEYGDCWYLSPQEGTPGNWSNWEMTLMAGEGDGTPRYTQPWISYDPEGDVLIYLFKGYFPSGNDTYPDVAILASLNGGKTWMDEGVWGSDPLEEEVCELPSRLSHQGNQTTLHSVFTAGDYLLHAGPYTIGVGEANPSQGKGLLLRFPNVVRDNLPLSLYLPFATHLEISLFSPSGRKVLSIYRGTLRRGFSSLNQSLRRLPSGVFILRLKTQGQNLEKKVLILN